MDTQLDTPTTNRTYFIKTFGCQMNEHDSERAAGVLRTMGYKPADDPESAGLVLFNTCAVRENADNKLYGQLSALKPLKLLDPTKRIVVGGCLAQKDQHLMAQKAPYIDVIYGTHNMGKLPELLAKADSAAFPVIEILEHTEMFPSALPTNRNVAHHAWVSISIGCDNTCTFCIVPSLRGPEKSRKIGEIVREVKELVAEGVSEITLLGQNVNSYGRDLVRHGEVPPEFGEGKRNRTLFAELLYMVGDVDGLERIRFTSPHPKDFTLDVLEAMRDVPAVCEQLHMPLQSGSDTILRAMKRSYRSKRFLHLVETAREIVPEVAISTDIIVGFPGETDEDFEATMEVTRQARFDASFVFKYSKRPGTKAADEPNQVPQAIVDERFPRLHKLTKDLSEASHQAQVGKVQQVLFDTISKRDEGMVSGRTRQNRLVHVPLSELATVGSLHDVHITRAANHFLFGELATQ